MEIDPLVVLDQLKCHYFDISIVTDKNSKYKHLVINVPLFKTNLFLVGISKKEFQALSKLFRKHAQ